MTPESCMTLADSITPNRISAALKRRWLAELEGHILVCIQNHDPEALDIRGEEEEALYLSAPFPFDRMYYLYLLAMIDFYNGDVSRYEESASLFNDALDEYAKWCKRERRS